MNLPQVFRYPRSGLLLARLLDAMGFGPKSWPGRQISPATLKRILADDPPTFVLRDFIDEALGLLGAPSGRWSIGLCPMTREQAFDLIYTGLREYDKAVSELNGSSPLVDADRRHALPILTLLSVRLGAFVGLVAAIREEPLDAVWQRSLLDPGAFGAAVSRYAEKAMPSASWRERGEASPIGKNTLDRWRKTPPGENFKFASLKRFAAWVAEKSGGDAAFIEWHLRWLAAGARIRGALDRYLGRDSHGEPWIDRLILTAQHHAGINFDLCTQRVGLEATKCWLEPDFLEGRPQEEVLVVRRVLAWACGRAQVIDMKGGPGLSDEELTQLRARLTDDEAIRRGFEARLGCMHALGLLAPGYLEVIHAHFGCLDQYSVHHKHPASYLKLQHDIIASRIENAHQELDPAFVDDHIAAEVKMVFHEERGVAFRHYCMGRFARLVAEPADFALSMAAVQQLVALQQELAGNPFVPPPAPMAMEAADERLREFHKLLELRRTLPKLVESGDEAAVTRELERAVHEHPEADHFAFWLMSLRSDQLLELYQQLLVKSAQVQILLAVLPEGSAPHHKFTGHERTLRKLEDTWNRAFDMVLSALNVIAERASDRWPVDLTSHLLAGRRAALALICRRKLPQAQLGPSHDEAVQSLRACLGPLVELHDARPEHPEPCVWLARFHALLDDRPEARRWARLAEQRGDLGGLQALAAS